MAPGRGRLKRESVYVSGFLSGLIALSLASESCVRVLNVTPLIEQLEIKERIERASMVVLGVVHSESTVRGQSRAGNSDSMSLELRRVKIGVEGVIKGHYHGARLTFLYYRATGAWDGPAPNILIPGKRAIFYLMNEGGELRTTNDAYSSHTEVVTGTHEVRPAAGSEEVREQIARLLLLPGKGMDTSRYVQSLYVERAIALDLIGESQTARLLRSLLRNPNGQVRGRACIQLNWPPLADRDCLPSLIHDTEALEQDRARAAELIREP